MKLILNYKSLKLTKNKLKKGTQTIAIELSNWKRKFKN